jgi:hypothetical protein
VAHCSASNAMIAENYPGKISQICVWNVLNRLAK